MSDALIFIISSLTKLYAMVVLLRFLMQWARADYYNPLAQFSIKLTQPVLTPLRRVIPGIKGLDIAALVLAYFVYLIDAAVTILGQGYSAGQSIVFVLALHSLLQGLINLMFYIIFAMALMSWIAPHGHPMYAMLNSIARPVLDPVRRLTPDLGGFDLSPVFVLIGLQALSILVKSLFFS